jgi:enamine deaminase RidA (YjgF/YER057c/UK114 family)
MSDPADGHASNPAQRVAELGLDLSSPFPAFGTYVMAVRSGSQLVTAGHVPVGPDGLVTGKLGGTLSVEDGYAAARLAAISLLATVQAELGDLGAVLRFVSVLATVNAVPEFTEHTAVADGASDLFVAVFGDAGRHARLAVGVGSLPADLAIEVQATIDLR